MKNQEEWFNVLTDIKADQRMIANELKAINAKFGELPCPVNTYKITLLQRIVYTGIGIVLFAFITGLVNDSTIVKKNDFPKKAQAAIVKKVEPK